VSPEPPARKSFASSLADNAATRILGITIFGAIIGLVCAFLALMFVDLVDYLSEMLRSSPVSRQGSNRGIGDFPVWIAITVPAIGGLITGLIIRFATASHKPQGPPDVIRATQARRGVMSLKEGLASTLRRKAPLVWAAGSQPRLRPHSMRPLPD